MSPKTKILVASALLLVLGAAAGAGGLSAPTLARLALGAAAVAAFAWWYLKGRQAADAEPPRLSVIARAGLSSRAGVALVEVDGQALLVVHGDGYAAIHRPRRGSAP